MFRLLSIEFHKLKYNRASKILSIIYFGLLTSIALIAAIKFEFGSFKLHLADAGIFNFPYIWHFNTYIAAILKFFLLLVIVSMMSNEYSYKTLKQNLIDGLSKKEFILSKFYMVLAFALISTIFVFVVSLILGLMYSDYNELSIIFSDMEYLLAFFIKLLGFFSFGLFLGILIKRSAFAVAGMLVWLIGEGICKGFLYYNFRGQENSSEKVDWFMQFLPLEAMTNLIKEPFSRLGAVRTAANTMGEAFTKNYDVQFSAILMVLFWTFIFIYFSYKLLEKRDL
ncbi:MAG: ABC transporter permease subunit [Flavobacteriia bacterium]|nr:ABC transporter permease subunit [Flavobacteriia bacterium]OIP48205.1 MAG: ABC transporter permease [Flavobacteriaceae bacterium CG2_30_31_66]PIV96677.1 MAG: ABC transporter permease [Flavobacteriaceae bacterium CG17_big_fil_post_rev_8_21_14_2_50_31_13]PIX13142.1 MAG: ABC transporter permease [Flavobacteriaceae bacterium CG_4_8_14_3_um_filter_31_8]PIY14416.1 MAG: ABC transporter permease [Flavobacteriaceae bacterium CG_4_10_14_3_um_filter_31_253]PIZ10002.1 MAG: ABC transporter permease [Fla